jgi:15-cis-phytoene synthase
MSDDDASATSAASITKSSKSNLALAFIALPRERRRDITTFYAFCRLVDDIADAPDISTGEKQRRLNLWRESLADSFGGEPALARPLRKVMQKYSIPRSYFEEIIAGVEMDIEPRYYQTFEELQWYCYRVASVVGLVSIEIFGYRNLASRNYAFDLGMALQLTNILRDVAEDHANGGRIYLPLDDLAQFGCTPEDLAAHRHDERFRALMNFEADRAVEFYAKAKDELPKEDRRAMIAAEIMRAVYQRILEKIRDDDFQVFKKRYALSGLEKTLAIARVIGATLLRLPLQGVR